MARPLKYNWEAIKKAYEDGIDKPTISRKYKVSKKTLANKIGSEKWKVMGGLDTDIAEFKDSLSRISQNTQNDPIKQEIALDKIETILEDNELIGNNRKLLKAFQGLVGRNIKDGAYKTPQDIKAGVSSIKDIEAVARPQNNQISVQNNNANILKQDIKIQWE